MLTEPAVRSRWPRWLGYALAVALVVATLLFRMSLGVAFGQRPLLILFVFPIILSAYLGGLGPGLVATLVAAVSVNYFLMPPAFSLSFALTADLAQWSMLIVNGVCISILVESFHRSRRQAEKSRLVLSRSEEHYRLLFDTMVQGVVYQDADGKIIAMNPAAEEILGNSAAALLEETSVSLDKYTVHPDGSPFPGAEHPSMLALRTRQNIQNVEMGVYNLNQQAYRWININAVPLFRPGSDQPYQVYTVFEDITERRRSEMALRESEERFRAFMDNNPAIAWAKDEVGRYVYFSETFKKRVGNRFADWRGKTDVELWPADIAEEFRKNDLAVLASDQVMEFIETAKLDRSLSYWLIFKFPFRDAAGKRYVGGVGLDITERQQAEDTVKAALREKEVLLKEIYHRTKNNLQVVCSLLNLQSARCRDPYLLQAFQDTGNRIRSMALVHEKLYQSKDLSHIDLKDYIKDLAYSLLITYQTEYGKISLHLDLQSVIVNIDTAMPCGLLLNELISNAIKYAFPGGRKGTISIFLRATEDGDIELSIADDGVGLPPGLDVWNTDSLGLKLIMNLAQNQLQGKVEVRRAQGTEFCIIFRELDYKQRI